VTSPGVRRLADTLAGGASGKARHRVRLAAFVRAAAIFVGVWGVGALSTSLQAQPVSAPTRYPLQIEAPEPLARLVREFTLLGRWQRREDFDPGQMPLFLDRAPREILDLLAAQGYFSAKVQVRSGPKVTGPASSSTQAPWPGSVRCICSSRAKIPNRGGGGSAN